MGKTRKDKISVALLLIASSVLAAASYVMLNDHIIYNYLKAGNSSAKTIAQIRQAKNDVRAKQANSFVWLKSFNNDELKNEDSVFTGSSSETDIDFKDGSIITTHPNTLIVVRSAEKGITIQKGSISVKLSKNMKKKFIINQKPIELTAKKDAVIEITNNGSDAPTIKVISENPLQEAVIAVTSEDKNIKLEEERLNHIIIEDVSPIKEAEKIENVDQIDEEITLTKVETPVEIKEEIEPVVLPPIPEVQAKFVEPMREPALSEIKEVKLPKISGFDLDFGISLGVTNLSNSANISDAEYIYPRSMLTSQAYFQLGYQFDKFTPFLYSEYFLTGQLTNVSQTGNQNMAGSGYVFGVGLKYDFDKYFISAVYEFYADYKLRKLTTLNEVTSYSGLTGYLLTVGYELFDNLNITVYLNYQNYKTQTTGSSTTNIDSYKLNSLSYGLGLVYEIF